MSKKEGLDKLRSEMRNITANIICQVQRRMELSRQIGEIKTKLNIDVMDEKVEQEVRSSILKLSKEIGMDTEFSGRLLNILLIESVRLQQKQQQNNNSQMTHLGIFMKAKQLEASGKKIIHMEVGEPDYPPPKNVKNALAQVYDLGQYHYTETKGIPKLRQAIAKKVGNSITADQVIVTAGGRFAVFGAFISLMKAGDEVISVEPAWPAYKDCADFIGAKTNILKTTLDEQWNPNVKKLEEMINANTKMIVLNYPNNPTGKILKQNIHKKIVSLAKDYGIYILSDEVYSDYAFNGFKSILEYNYDKSIMISSFSKGHAMTGFRVGYGIADKDIITKMTKVQATILTSVAEPMQYSALAALEASPDKNVKLMKKRLDIISNKLRKMSLPFVEPDGGMYVYPQLKDGKEDDVTLVEKLLDLSVAIAPGSGFGDSYRQFIRISACQPEHVLEKGLDILEAAMFSG
ncbi:MAG: aminotransferase class I/II-fold pyridoxal phosphate-dependent enzyme [Nitrososphaeraceae archaeon]|jgi:aspartate aminotransferase